MKKLTAGIFTVLMGLVTVNAAEAAVASKGYVDTKVGTNTSAIETLTQTVADNKSDANTAIAAAKKAGDDAAAALESYKTTNNAAVQKNAADIATNAAAIATNATSISTNATAIETEKSARETADAGLDTRLQGVEGKFSGTGDGSVAKQIADAVAGEKSAREAADETLQGKIDEINDAENGILAGAKDYTDAEVKKLADGAVKTNTDAIAAINDEGTGILKQAQTYADGLATNYDAAGSAAAAQAAAEKTASDALNAYKTTNDAAVSANTNAISAINNAETGILKQSKDYTDTEIEKIDTAYKAADAKIDSTIGEVAEGKTVVEMIADAQTAATYDDTTVKAGIKANADAIGAIEASEYATSGITAEKVSVYDGYNAKITANTNAAAAAQTAADNAQAAADDAQATADAAIPAPTGPCQDAENKCVLTYNNSVYTWEVIERADGETVE